MLFTLIVFKRFVAIMALELQVIQCVALESAQFIRGFEWLLPIYWAELTFDLYKIDASSAEKLFAIQAFLWVDDYLVAYGTDKIFFDFILGVFFVHKLPDVSVHLLRIQLMQPLYKIFLRNDLFHF